MAEALALLENREYKPKKKSLLQRLDHFEHLLRTPTSIFAAKTAAAATVYAVRASSINSDISYTIVKQLLILVQKPQTWFIKYGLTSGLLTIIVALAPTLGKTIFLRRKVPLIIHTSLGQSILTFVLQIAGSGIGIVYGLILLEIFQNVGGFIFNP